MVCTIEERITAMASTVAQMGFLAIIVHIGDSAIAAAPVNPLEAVVQADLLAVAVPAVHSVAAVPVVHSEAGTLVGHSAVAVPVDPLAAAVAAAVTEA